MSSHVHIRRNHRLLLVAMAMVILNNMGYAQNKRAKVRFEAETASRITKSWRKVLPGPTKSPIYSGAGYLELPPSDKQPSYTNEAVYRVNIKSPGVYYIMARTFWMNGYGNSISVAANGSKPFVLGYDSTFDKWHWVISTVRLPLKAGTNILDVKSPKTGVRLDRFELSQESNSGYSPRRRPGLDNAYR